MTGRPHARSARFFAFPSHLFLCWGHFEVHDGNACCLEYDLSVFRNGKRGQDFTQISARQLQEISSFLESSRRRANSPPAARRSWRRLSPGQT